MIDIHDYLLRSVMIISPKDYVPWGEVEPKCCCDCLCGCAYALWLEDVGKQLLSMDRRRRRSRKPRWCVCTNPRSHRCGLLTFEHQGCQKFSRIRRRGYAGPL